MVPLMSTHSIKTKLLAIFIVAFVCLNAGGGACLVYCRTTNVVETEHCPLKKTVEHCDKSVSKGPKRASISLGTAAITCGPMTGSFFSGPIEKNASSLARPAVAAASQPRSFHLAFSMNRSSPDPVSYRGPPPLDSRVLRIRHCIIRI